MGGVSLAQLDQVIERHGAEASMERYKRLPNKAGEWDYASAELQLWVSGDGFRPLLRDLKGLEEDGFSVTVTPILAIQEMPNETRKEQRRPRVNGLKPAPRGAKPGGQAMTPRAEKQEAEEAEP